MQGKKDLKILIIDDDEVIRLSLRGFLEDMGYHILEAKNGKEGIQIFERQAPSLILVDLRMPEVDGLDVLSHVTKESPDTPVIVISGAGVVGDVVEALRLGAWDYILKPIHDMHFLDYTVKKALERSNLRRENKIYQRNLEESLLKIKEDEKAGLKIQTKLLPPRKSKIGPYTLTQRLLPSAFLSGDFLDYFLINDDCIAFYIADVSGHGVSSSLVTVLLKSFMKKFVEKFHIRNDYSIFHPGELLQKFNTELIKENIDKYVTLFYGVLIIPDNKVRFSGAGQFPCPIIFTPGKVNFLECKNKPVGLFPNVQFQETEFKLPPEFMLTLFSDGILEIIDNADIEAKKQFLISLDARSKIDKFFLKFKNHESIPDDVAVLVISQGEQYETR